MAYFALWGRHCPALARTIWRSAPCFTVVRPAPDSGGAGNLRGDELALYDELTGSLRWIGLNQGKLGPHAQHKFTYLSQLI